MINYLLQEIEKSPHALFTKKELVALSQRDFEYLTGKKVLTYFRPPENDMEKVGSLRCQHGCALTLVTVEGGLEGVCLNHPEEDPVPVEEDDLCRYAFSTETLLNNIRIANKLNGELHTIDGYCVYVGYKTYNARRTGFVFISQINDEQLIKSLGLKRLCEKDDILIILTPFSKIEDVAIKTNMRHDRIIQISLADSLDFQCFELSVEIPEELGYLNREKNNTCIRPSFVIKSGQVFYQNTDINLPTGRPQEIFGMLFTAYPDVVKYNVLDGSKDEVYSASDQLRKDVNIINSRLRAHSISIPFMIKSKRNIGYYLTPITE